MTTVETFVSQGQNALRERMKAAAKIEMSKRKRMENAGSNIESNKNIQRKLSAYASVIEAVRGMEAASVKDIRDATKISKERVRALVSEAVDRGHLVVIRGHDKNKQRIPALYGLAK